MLYFMCWIGVGFLGGFLGLCGRCFLSLLVVFFKIRVLIGNVKLLFFW